MKSKFMIIIFILIAFSSVSYAKNKDNLIIPKVGVGYLFLGKTTTSDVINWIGNPTKSGMGENGLIYIYEKHGFILAFNKHNILHSIIVSNAYYKTEKNIGVGSTVANVFNAYPGAKMTADDIISTNDLSFQYDVNTDKVIKIFVSNKI